MPSGLQSKDSRKAHILDRKAFIFFELISLFFNELFEYYLNMMRQTKYPILLTADLVFINSEHKQKLN